MSYAQRRRPLVASVGPPGLSAYASSTAPNKPNLPLFWAENEGGVKNKANLLLLATLRAASLRGRVPRPGSGCTRFEIRDSRYASTAWTARQTKPISPVSGPKMRVPRKNKPNSRSESSARDPADTFGGPRKFVLAVWGPFATMGATASAVRSRALNLIAVRALRESRFVAWWTERAGQ